MDAFTSNIINIYGERGRLWLEELPLLVEKIASKYHLSDLVRIKELSYNYVLKGQQNNKPIVLKLSADINALNREAEALKAYDGSAAVKVLVQEDGFLILEQAVPGDSLKSYFPDSDEAAVKIVCDVIKKLHKAPVTDALHRHCEEVIRPTSQSSEFTYQNIAQGAINVVKITKLLDCHVANAPRNDDKLAIELKPYLSKALALEAELLKLPEPDVLLHGDLHHENIIANGDSWVAIDPKGYIGSSAYEVAAFIRNPMPDLLQHKDALAIIQKRIRLFSQYLDLPEEKIKAWCFVAVVQSWLWAIEDNGDSKYFAELVQVFDQIIIS